MNFLRFSRFLQAPGYRGRRFIAHSIESDVFDIAAKNSVSFYMDLLNLSSTRTRKLLAEHPSLYHESVNFKDVKATAECLREYNFTNQNFIDRPLTLLVNKITALNRLKVLEECSFSEFKLVFIYRFVAVINKDVAHLKAFNYIHKDASVPQNILSRLDIPIKLKEPIGEEVTLKVLRETITNLYLRRKLGMTDQDITKLWKVYSRLRHKSTEGMVNVINLLLDRLKFPEQRIINNMFLLYACADNISQMIAKVPQIGGVPMEKLILKRPKIAMQNADTVWAIVKLIKSYDIPESSILKCLEVLTLGPDTVHERLSGLYQVSEFNVLSNNPRVLRLILYQTKAITRLEFLKQLKIKCASLNVLSTNSETFEKYARDGVDRTNGRDCIYFLAKALSLDREQVRAVLSRHPHWCHVPIISVKAVLDYLRYKKFTLQEISQNMILLLYPISRIEEKLKALLEWKAENDDNRMISGVAMSAVSNEKLLNLCLYFIESEFHFSGDGIWEPSTLSNKQDIFPSSIPEFPKSLSKDYRYGVQKKSSDAISALVN